MEPTHGAPRWRLPVLTPLVAAVLLVLLVVPAPPVRMADETPWCLWDPGIPAEAYRVEEFVRTHNYSPPPGLKGGRPFEDRGGILPFLLAPFREYDVYPKPPGQTRRPSPRVVLAPSVPYASWYTSDHYATFRFMFPPQCLTLPTRRLLP